LPTTLLARSGRKVILMSLEKEDSSSGAAQTMTGTTGESRPRLSILAELKDKTATVHRALEESAGIWDCRSSRASYANLLVRFWGIYSSAEARLAAVEDLPQWLPDLRRRWKRSALESDLNNLGIPPACWTICTGTIEIRTVAAGFGWLYVLEGSTLGGQLIKRQVQERLGLSAQNGCQFFSSYGAEVGPMWRSFGHSLESFCHANPNCRDQVTASAETAFECFLNWLGSK
jgi:heme oxygenase (biliverdin-IX-beta and delta-forming)